MFRRRLSIVQLNRFRGSDGSGLPLRSCISMAVPSPDSKASQLLPQFSGGDIQRRFEHVQHKAAPSIRLSAVAEINSDPCLALSTAV
jgi:hypothetical protein